MMRGVRARRVRSIGLQGDRTISCLLWYKISTCSRCTTEAGRRRNEPASTAHLGRLKLALT